MTSCVRVQRNLRAGGQTGNVSRELACAERVSHGLPAGRPEGSTATFAVASAAGFPEQEQARAPEGAKRLELRTGFYVLSAEAEPVSDGATRSGTAESCSEARAG